MLFSIITQLIFKFFRRFIAIPIIAIGLAAIITAAVLLSAKLGKLNYLLGRGRQKKITLKALAPTLLFIYGKKLM
jgi:hypothetical protein